jgi:hypothetical protein
MSLQPTYTIRDVAEMFGVSPRTIQSRVSSGQLASRNLTKTGCAVHALVPRQLISLLESLLEQYLAVYRPALCFGSDPGTLFLNEVGRAMSLANVTNLVAQLTLRHGGRRVTPHVFRDIVAYTWLKHHPKDYLTLSKHLWHSGPMKSFGRTEAALTSLVGVGMTESWLNERKAKT